MNFTTLGITPLQKGDEDSSTIIISDEDEEGTFKYVIDLQTEYDLNGLLRNLLANPSIRSVKIQKETPLTDALKKVLNGDVLPDNTIEDSPYKLNKQITDEHLTRLQRRISLKDHNKKEPEGKQIIIPDMNPEPPRKHPTRYQSFTIHGRTYREAYDKLLDRLFRYGEVKEDTVILPNITMTFDEVTDEDKIIIENAEQKTILHESKTTKINEEEKTTIFVEELDAWNDMNAVLHEYKEEITLFIGVAYLQNDELETILENLNEPSIEENLIDDIQIRKENDIIKAVHHDNEGSVIEVVEGKPEDVITELLKKDKVRSKKQAIRIGRQIHDEHTR